MKHYHSIIRADSMIGHKTAMEKNNEPSHHNCTAGINYNTLASLG
jgi:hypothetical protein